MASSFKGESYEFVEFDDAVKRLILEAGDDPDRPGLKETPERVARAFQEMFAGYHLNPERILKTFEDGAEGYDEMVVVKDVEFVSFCEHHLLPFQGVAHVGYLPHQRIVGLSKLARLVDVYAKRLQVQERMTQQTAHALMNVLNPKGCGVVVEATHTCLSCRGAKKQNAVMVTSCLLGAFRDDDKTRSEFLQFVRR